MKRAIIVRGLDDSVKTTFCVELTAVKNDCTIILSDYDKMDDEEYQESLFEDFEKFTESEVETLVYSNVNSTAKDYQRFCETAKINGYILSAVVFYPTDQENTSAEFEYKTTLVDKEYIVKPAETSAGQLNILAKKVLEDKIKSRRNSAKVVEARVLEVLESILNGQNSHEITKHFALAWSVSEQTIYNYIKKANEHFKVYAKTEGQIEIGKAITRLNKLFNKSLQIMDFKTCLAVQKEINEMLALKKKDGQEVLMNLITLPTEAEAVTTLKDIDDDDS